MLHNIAQRFGVPEPEETSFVDDEEIHNNNEHVQSISTVDDRTTYQRGKGIIQHLITDCFGINVKLYFIYFIYYFILY